MLGFRETEPRMGEREEPASESSAKAPAKKKPYQKPAFRQEPMFETMALSCGKINSTQGQCHSSRKSS
jgi:hypothetical protein